MQDLINRQSATYKNNPSGILLTCNVVHRVKADAEPSDFERVVSLPAPGDLLNAVPVLHREHGVVVDVQRRACSPLSQSLSQSASSINPVQPEVRANTR